MDLHVYRSEMILAQDQYEVCLNRTKIRKIYATITARQVILNLPISSLEINFDE